MYQCGYLISYERACYRIALWSGKVVCAHEHLYNTMLCEDHRGAETVGCWECATHDTNPHVRCPTQVVDIEPIPVDINVEEQAQWWAESLERMRAKVVADRQQAINTESRLSEILSDAIPKWEGEPITTATTDIRETIEKAIKMMRQS